jgi:hypothetical protein
MIFWKKCERCLKYRETLGRTSCCDIPVTVLQISFWNFILNPFNRRDFVKPEYVTGEDPIECHIAPEQDENVENKYMLNGGTLFVNTSTVDDEKDDDEKSQDDEKDSSK